MHRFIRFVLAAFTLSAVIAPLVLAENLPTSWVDKDTGHRVIRLTNEPGSSGFERCNQYPQIRVFLKLSHVFFTYSNGYLACQLRRVSIPKKT